MPPKYQEIAATLRAQIESGERPADSKLPPERELIEMFGAAQGTVRRALAVLQNEGLITGRKGSGIFVRAQFRIIARNATRRLSRQQWGEGKSIWAVDIDTRHMDVDRVRVFRTTAPDHVAQVLDTSDTWARDRRYLVEGQPVMLATSYLPAEIVEGSPITEVDSGEGGTYARLLELGYAPDHFREELRVYLPTEDVADMLELPAGQQVVEIARLTWTASGRIVEVNTMISDPRKFVYQYDFPA